MKRPEQFLAKLLKENDLTIALAESVTCGLLAHKLGSVSSTSDFLKCSIVCYAEEIKITLMKIPQSLIKKHTAESQEVTDRLAKNLSRLVGSDLTLAITGLASPGGSETSAKPVGTIFHSVYFKNKLFHQEVRFRGSPLEIKTKACESGLKFVIRTIKKDS